MKINIVEPSYDILTSADGLIEHLEYCGRTCYKSEDRIEQGTADKFIRRLIKSGHESVLEHASMTVKFVCDRACSHQLVRHRLASFCLSGDTIVRSYRGFSGGTCKGWTLKQLYDWSLDVKRKGRLKLINLRSVNEDGLLVPNKIKSIISSGKQEVYKVTTEFGREIKATLKHRFLTPTGYTALSDLKSGSKIIANGLAACDNPEWIKDQYLTQNKSRRTVAKLAGVSDSCLGKRIALFGLQKPKTAYPGRKPGHGNPGMFSSDMKKQMSEAHKGAKNPMWLGHKASKLAGNQRCWKMYDTPMECQACRDTDKDIERHHKDHNPLNNEPENIMFLCTSCHNQWHRGQGVMSVFTDTIVSIESVGVEDTYDIEMEAPYHNFVANGCVVHNSQESQRYCNYGKKGFQFIAPKSLKIPVGEYANKPAGCIVYSGNNWDATKPLLTPGQSHWLLNRFNDCIEYERLLETMKPEDARSVLPNATKTEVIVSCNMRQWRHMFRERAFNKHAQWQIRELMQGVCMNFVTTMPCLFEDLI